MVVTRRLSENQGSPWPESLEALQVVAGHDPINASPHRGADGQKVLESQPDMCNGSHS